MRKAPKLGKETVGSQECPWQEFIMAKEPGRGNRTFLYLRSIWQNQSTWNWTNHEIFRIGGYNELVLHWAYWEKILWRTECVTVPFEHIIQSTIFFPDDNWQTKLLCGIYAYMCTCFFLFKSYSSNSFHIQGCSQFKLRLFRLCPMTVWTYYVQS